MTILEVLLLGRFTGSPDGVMKLLVSMKNINKRKMISVMDDMLNAALTLCFDRRSIFIWALVTDQ
jgi:hypothetical protein